MRFNISPSIVLNRWDKRKWPMPFSRIIVAYNKPMYLNTAISAFSPWKNIGFVLTSTVILLSFFVANFVSYDVTFSPFNLFK